MQIKTTGTLLVGILLAGGVTTSCTRATIHYRSGVQASQPHRNGPPPHAPAHGYRHKHADGVDLVYQSSLGLYIVAGHDNHFYYKESYYRLHEGNWQTSKKFKGPWKKAASRNVPQSLRDNEHASRRKK